MIRMPERRPNGWDFRGYIMKTLKGSELSTWAHNCHTFHTDFSFFSGDPCVHPERIPSRAPEVYCQNGRLVGATRSNHDHIVIGMVQSEQRYVFGNYQASQISNRCTRRKNQGYRSGMGSIFVEVASINPIN